MPDRPEQDRPAPSTPAEWAHVLKHDWERRSRHPSRDFFVASHPGWDDPEQWRARARTQAEAMLLGMDLERLAREHMLEIGCGVGRLTAHYLDRVRSYTGIDISEGMIEEARARHAGVPEARFFPCDGLSVPEAARDRQYGLILALAVFIHCPRSVIASWIEDGYGLLAAGGMLRFQVLGDLRDPTGIVSQEAAEEVHERARRNQEIATGEQLELIEDTPYMGSRFAYDDLRQFTEELTPGRVELLRTDLVHIYGSVQKPL